MAQIRQKWKLLNRPLQAAIYIIAGLIILFIIFQIIISVWGDSYIGQRLKKKVVQSSNGVYRLTYSDLDLGLFTNSITIYNLRLHADTSVFHADGSFQLKPPNVIYKGHVDKFKISGLHLLSALIGNELTIGTILIKQPDLTVIKNPHSVDQNSGKELSSLNSMIYAAISEKYHRFKLQTFKIIGGHLHSLQSGDTLAFVDNLTLSLSNILIDSATVSSGRKLITNDISLHAKHMMIKLPDSLYKVKLKKVVISSRSQSILFDSLRLIPRYPKFKFGKVNGAQIDRIDLSIPRLELRHVDFAAFAKSGRLHVGYIEIDHARLQDFHSMIPPSPPPSRKRLYNSKLFHLNQKVKIDSIKVKDSYVSYAEYHEAAPQAGKVTFENLNATFRNVTNYPEAIDKGKTIKVYARASVMGKGLLQVHWAFPLDTQNAFHQVRGSLGPMPLTAFNPILKYVAFVKVDHGKLNSMQFKFIANSDSASGTLTMSYQNLKVSMLKKETEKQQGLLNNILSFVANVFIIDQNNVPKSGTQAGTIDFKRNKYKSTWNFWWKSLLSGIKDAIK